MINSRSNRDFVAKLGVVIEEADETSYWLEILVDAKIVTASAVSALRREADELIRLESRTLNPNHQSLIQGHFLQQVDIGKHLPSAQHH